MIPNTVTTFQLLKDYIQDHPMEFDRNSMSAVGGIFLGMEGSTRIDNLQEFTDLIGNSQEAQSFIRRLCQALSVEIPVQVSEMELPPVASLNSPEPEPESVVSPSPVVSQTQTFIGLVELNAQLEIINNKAAQLQADGNHRAATAALELHRLMTEEIRKLNASEVSVPDFRASCTLAIEQSRPALEAFGWKEILGNLSLAVLGVGVVFLVACLINKAVTGNFLFFGTSDTTKKLDALKECVEQVDVNTL